MQIGFTPQAAIPGDTRRLEASVNGDVLTVNGVAFDFSALPDGATLPRRAVACDWLASDVVRDSGAIHLILTVPHGVRAPRETRFPVPVNVTDGPVPVPPYEIGTEARA